MRVRFRLEAAEDVTGARTVTALVDPAPADLMRRLHSGETTEDFTPLENTRYGSREMRPSRVWDVFLEQWFSTKLRLWRHQTRRRCFPRGVRTTDYSRGYA